MIRTLQTCLKPFGTPMLKSVIAILVLIVVALLIMRHNDATAYDKNVTEWKAKSQQVLTTNDSVLQVVKTLEVQSDSLKAQAEVYSGQIDSIRTVANRKPRPSKLPKLPIPDTCTAIAADANTQRERADELDSALTIAETRDSLRIQTIGGFTVSNQLLLQQNDSLRSVIIIVPIYKQPKFLGFIPYPSRKTTFVTGILTGVGSAIVIKKNSR